MLSKPPPQAAYQALGRASNSITFGNDPPPTAYIHTIPVHHLSRSIEVCIYACCPNILPKPCRPFRFLGLAFSALRDPPNPPYMRSISPPCLCLILRTSGPQICPRFWSKSQLRPQVPQIKTLLPLLYGLQGSSNSIHQTDTLSLIPSSWTPVLPSQAGAPQGLKNLEVPLPHLNLPPPQTPFIPRSSPTLASFPEQAPLPKTSPWGSSRTYGAHIPFPDTPIQGPRLEIAGPLPIPPWLWSPNLLPNPHDSGSGFQPPSPVPASAPSAHRISIHELRAHDARLLRRLGLPLGPEDAHHGRHVPGSKAARRRQAAARGGVSVPPPPGPHCLPAPPPSRATPPSWPHRFLTPSPRPSRFC